MRCCWEQGLGRRSRTEGLAPSLGYCWQPLEGVVPDGVRMGQDHNRLLPGWRVVPFILFAAAIYAGLSMLTGESLSGAAVSGLIWATLFVPAFLWITGKINAKAIEKRGIAKSDGPVSSESIHVRAHPNEVIDIIIGTTEQIPRARVMRSDQRGLDIQMGMSFRSWGERVQVEVTPQEVGTSVTVTSRPALRMTLFDYGKGQENVRRLMDALNEHSLGE